MNYPHKKYSVSFRIWHWLNAIAVLGLLGTTFLRKTFLSYKTNARIIQDGLAKMDMEISVDAAKNIAKEIRSPMWEWHYIFGFMLVLLFIYRLVLHFTSRPLFSAAELKESGMHDKGVAFLYLVLYLLTGIMSVTGIVMYFGAELGFEKDTVKAIKEFHELLMYFFAFFVPVHIAGVFMAEQKQQKGIVSNMIGGE